MQIHALGTHSDWVYNGGAWGKPGHQRIADLTYAAGIRRLYWRTHNGGQAKYPSKVCTVVDGSHYRDPAFTGVGSLPKSYFTYGEYIDYRDWDQVADMFETGTRVGLEVCHWYTVFEDDHGGHLGSDFAKKHPEFLCQLKSGEPVSGCLDFWYPEVQDYKLAIVDELLEKPTRRLLLDFLRRNGKPSADAAGNYRYGYNPEIRAGFLQETGLDARHIEPGTPEWEAWLDYTAKPLTEFLRKVRAKTQAKGIPLDVLVWAVDTRRWQALDLPTLVSEGVVDEVLTGTHRYAFSAADAQRQVLAMQEYLGGTARIAPALFCYHQVPPLTVDEFLGEAESLGCSSVVLHEANHVVECPIGDRLRAWQYGLPHSKRSVQATSAAPGNEPIVYEGFIQCHDVFGNPCDQKTRFSVAYDADHLFVNVECMERQSGSLVPVPGIGVENYNGNELKARAFWNPYESVHFFLDARHDHEDYHHFVLDPAGGMLAETRLDEDWSGSWSGNSTVQEGLWTARFVIPWTALGVSPQAGQTFGFQIVRIQNNPRQVSAWFCTSGRRVNPLDFGHLILS